MTGNDVVDIIQARKESNWQRRGFLDKLFTPSEQEIILKAKNPETMVWLLWSMKEAAYKIFNRCTAQRLFMPLRLECKIEYYGTATARGSVSCGKTSYFTKTEIADDIIHTVAALQPADFAFIKEIYPDMVFKDKKGFPYIYGTNTPEPVSVSHHGRGYKVIKYAHNL